MYYNILMIIASVLASVFCGEDKPVVEAPAGMFRGHVSLKSRNGRDIISFEGIPYALPPIGPLRFKDPVKMPVLNETYEANIDHIMCYQPSLDFSQLSNVSSYLGSENCLYLNIHKPKLADKKPLPVLFWIHGGGFIMGTGSREWHAPNYYLDKDIILVTVNYRQGILGYLSTGDDVIPGNFGMKDVILALKWVKENIASFGGDSSSVTVGGISSGASTASLLMHSPLSKGLFHKVIAQSGTAFCSFTTKHWKLARKDARNIANYLGCDFESEKFLKCLQKASKEEVANASTTLYSEELIMFDFIPVIEKESPNAFLTLGSLNRPSKMPFLTGVTNQESINLIRILAGKKYQAQVTEMKPDLEKLMKLMGFYNFLMDKENITKRLAHYYYGDEGFSAATELQITDYMSDVLFNYGMYVAGRKELGPTYQYMLSFKASEPVFPFQLPKELEDGVSHEEDMQYFFPIKFPLTQRKSDFKDQDLEMSKKLINLWYNFAKYGNPTPDTKLWEESEKGVKFLDIMNQGLVMKKNMFQDRMNFLDKLNIDRYNLAE